MAERKIGVLPFCSVLFLSVMSGVLLYIADNPAEPGGTDAVLRPLVFLAVNLAAALPLFRLKRAVGDRSIGEALRARSPFAARLIAAVYALVYTAAALRTAVRFELFAGSEMFPDKRMTYLAVLLAAVCAVLGGADFSATARASFPMAVGVILAAAGVGLLLVPQVDLLNLTPPFENGVGRFLRDSLSASLFAAEAGTLPFFFGQVKGNLKRGYVVGAVLVTVLFAASSFVVFGTLGPFAESRLFPTCTAVTLAKIGLFKRLDSVESAVWVSCVLVKMTLFFTVASRAAAQVFHGLPRRAAALLAGAAVALCVLLIGGEARCAALFSSLAFTATTYLLPAFILPLASLLCLKRRGTNGTFD